MEVEGNGHGRLPWYRNLGDPLPFHLQLKFEAEDPDTVFSCIEPFPWDMDSLNFLWSGSFGTPDRIQAGAAFIDEEGMFTIDMTEHTTSDGNTVFCCAWGIINPNGCLEPVVIFNDATLLHILNVKRRRVVGTLAGHGGSITSIAVHPGYPYLICTTSRDFTSRIYDLNKSPRQKPNNPHWPPGTAPSRGGAPAGLHSSEPEGYAHDVGRCVAILTGGRSGGHQAAVLNSAFHPILPLIATCGVDRAVKIWKLPSLEDESLAREDKPLFSSSRIHQSRVLSVTWLSEGTLLSHCATVLLRTNEGQKQLRDQVCEFPGSLVLWRWLGVDRFFPRGEVHKGTLRGCASDYQESGSFKLISEYSIPKSTQHLHLYKSHDNDPIIILSLRNKLRIINITSFQPRPRQPFPYSEPSALRSPKRRRISDSDEEEDGLEFGDSNEVRQRAARNILDVPGWDLVAGDHDLFASAMVGGRMIIAIGHQRNARRSAVLEWQLTNGAI